MDLFNRLNHLFGDEEHVGYRKQLVILRENIMSSLDLNKEFRVVCSGSLGEGVDYPTSDDDLMIYSVLPSKLVRTKQEDVIFHGGVLMIPSEYSPGFCILQLPMNYSDTYVVRIHESNFISSVLYRDAFLGPGDQPHGPCASITMDEMFEYDFAHCLQCYQWPPIANDWISRARRSGWPPRIRIEEIVNGGCHVVPIGDPDSPLCDLEWRVSFSVAERTLIHSFNHVQFLIYNILKLVLKRIIDVRVPDALCSYFMKTVMFYAMENTVPEVWVPEQVDECYNKGLLLLYHYIDRMNCPSYFIPDNNMMRRKVKPHNRPPLLDVITELMSHGITGSLHLCRKSDVAVQHVTQREIEWKGDQDLLTGYLWNRSITEVSMIFDRKYNNVREILSDLRELVKLGQTSHARARAQGTPGVTKGFLKKVCSIAGLKSLVNSKSCSNNKEKLAFINTGQLLLRRGCGSDVSSGRIDFATYLYMTGRFRDCLLVVNDLLSKYSPYVINESMVRHNCIAEEMYMNHVCGNGYSLDYKMKIAWALDAQFDVKNAHAYPLPVKMLLLLHGDDGNLTICPRVYSFFLQGLCFHHIDNVECFRNSITALEGILKDPETEIENYKWSVLLGRILGGYMRMLQQDYHSALCHFTSAYLTQLYTEFRPLFKIIEGAKHAPLIFIACVLNRTIP